MWTLLAALLALASDGNESSLGPNDVLKRAAALERSGDDAQAASVLAQAVRADPTWAMARLELGRLELKRGIDTRAAEFHLDAARTLAPENPRAHYLYALAADERGHRLAAFRALEVALQLREDYSDARFRLAGLHFVQGDYAAAALAYERYVQRHPQEPSARLQLAQAFERAGQSERAERVLRGLLADAKARPLAQRRLVELLERAGRGAEAQKLDSASRPPKKSLRPLKPSRH